jgi:hypothetical protein
MLALTLDQITLNGQPYSIQTSEFEETIKGRGKRTAIGAGGGAAFGAIVGGLAGGGKVQRLARLQAAGRELRERPSPVSATSQFRPRRGCISN